MPLDSKAQIKVEKQRAIAQVPKKWPDGIQYLHDQIYSAGVTDELKDALSRAPTANETLPIIANQALQAPCPLVQIQNITKEGHPACNQGGLFASQHLEPESFICLYIGKVHTNSLLDTDPNSDYDLAYDREYSLSIDAALCGNESRFINDYRGISDRPNAEFRDCLIRVKSEKRVGGVKLERRVGIFVFSAGKAGKRSGGIKAGEEIVVSYGKSFWEARKVVAKFRGDVEMGTSSQSA